MDSKDSKERQAVKHFIAGMLIAGMALAFLIHYFLVAYHGSIKVQEPNEIVWALEFLGFVVILGFGILYAWEAIRK